MHPLQVNGLILTGGKSERMGWDKAAIEYHGKPQAIYLVELLDRVGIPACISCRPGDAGRWAPFPTIEDHAEGFGPMAGIMAAFSDDPDSALLVIACDYPLLRIQDIRWLLSQRAPGYDVTAVSLKEGLGEPLLAIWESRSYRILADSYASGNFKMMDVLSKLDVILARPEEPHFFKQANDPQAKKEALEFLGKHPSGKN